MKLKARCGMALRKQWAAISAMCVLGVVYMGPFAFKKFAFRGVAVSKYSKLACVSIPSSGNMEVVESQVSFLARFHSLCRV